MTVDADVLHLDNLHDRPFPGADQTVQPTPGQAADPPAYALICTTILPMVARASISSRASGNCSNGTTRPTSGLMRPARRQLDQVGVDLFAHLRRRGIETRTGRDQGGVRVSQDDAHQ